LKSVTYNTNNLSATNNDVNWFHLWVAEDRVQWYALVNMVIDHQIPESTRHFLTRWLMAHQAFCYKVS